MKKFTSIFLVVSYLTSLVVPLLPSLEYSAYYNIIVDELYSDHIPASKAQTSAEFVGNTQLDPERSSQLKMCLMQTT